MSTLPEQGFTKLTITQTNTASPSSRHILIVDNGAKSAKIAPWEPYPTLTPLPASDDHADTSTLQFNAESIPLPEPIRGFKGFDGKIRLFRPMDMLATMNSNLGDEDLPQISAKDLLKCIDKLLQIDSANFTPGEMISIHFKQFHVLSGICSTPKNARLYCNAMQSKLVLDYNGDFKPLKLQTSEITDHFDEHADEEVCLNGCDRFLNLYNKEVLYISDAAGGDANFFVMWINDENKKQVVTYPLESDDYVIPGITRDSILQMLSTANTDLDVIERRFSIDDLSQKAHEGKLIEAFSCGSDDIISPVGMIKLLSGEELKISTVVENKWGELSKKLYETLIAIMRGDIEHEWSHVAIESAGAINSQDNFQSQKSLSTIER